jgi:hypothetical protein
VTVESDIASLGELLASTKRAFEDEQRAHGDTISDLGWALERADRLEVRVQELEAEVAASTAVDLLGRYRRACIENAALTRRVAELESRAATAGAAAEALKGNR